MPSPSCARPRMLSAASWVPGSRCSWRSPRVVWAVPPWQPSHALVGSVPQGEERRFRGLLHTTCSSRASRDRPSRRVASWAFVAAVGGTQHREEVAGARAPAGPAWADGSAAGNTPAARAIYTTRLSGSRPSLRVVVSHDPTDPAHSEFRLSPRGFTQWGEFFTSWRRSSPCCADI